MHTLHLKKSSGTLSSHIEPQKALVRVPLGENIYSCFLCARVRLSLDSCLPDDSSSLPPAGRVASSSAATQIKSGFALLAW
jgi:hypothetical protein